MASLTLAQNSGALATTDEQSLTEEQWELVQRVADGPPPALPLATDEDVRVVIGALAGSPLKRRNMSTDEGRLNLGIYRKALTGHITKPALSHAANRAIRELEWMPTPAELFQLGKSYGAPEGHAYSRARYLARQRRHRLFLQAIKDLRERKIPKEDLNSLSDGLKDAGIGNRSLLEELDGTVIYFTLDDFKRIRAEREQGLADANERSIARAREEGQDD